MIGEMIHARSVRPWKNLRAVSFKANSAHKGLIKQILASGDNNTMEPSAGLSVKMQKYKYVMANWHMLKS